MNDSGVFDENHSHPRDPPKFWKKKKSEDKIIGRGEKKSQTYGCSASNLGIKRANPFIVRLPSVT